MNLPVSIHDISSPGHLRFLLQTWINSMKEMSPYRSCDKNWFSCAQNALISRLLSKDGTRFCAATSPEDPDQLYGVLVCTPAQRILHWVYVKRFFRQMGVANRLMEYCFGTGDITATMWSRDVEHLAERWGVTKRTYGLCEVMK